jgi:hypothetical protein
MVSYSVPEENLIVKGDLKLLQYRHQAGAGAVTARASKGRREFAGKDIELLLVACHRRCCICHRFCGVKIEVDHIESAHRPSSGEARNAIPLCFECHAEVHHYNPRHPKGRKLTPSELRRHKEQWLNLCREHPDIFVASQQPAEAGSLERLASELTFNLRIANYSEGALRNVGAPFEVAQLRSAIAGGTFTWISDPLRKRIQDAYAAILQTNSLIEGARSTDRGDGLPRFLKPAQEAAGHAKALINEALDYLLLSMGSDYP